MDSPLIVAHKARIAAALTENLRRQQSPEQQRKNSKKKGFQKPLKESTLTGVVGLLAEGKELQPKTIKKKPMNLEKFVAEQLTKRGFTVEKMSRYDARTGRSHDFMGIWDLLAGKDGKTYAIQVTSKANRSARLKKITIENKSAFERTVRVFGMSPYLILVDSKTKAMTIEPIPLGAA